MGAKTGAKSKGQLTHHEWLHKLLEVPGEPEVPLAAAFRRLHKYEPKRAVGAINAEFGTRYNRKRYREWERGATRLPDKIRVFMQAQVIMARFDITTARALGELLDIPLPFDDLL